MCSMSFIMLMQLSFHVHVGWDITVTLILTFRSISSALATLNLRALSHRSKQWSSLFATSSTSRNALCSCRYIATCNTQHHACNQLIYTAHNLRLLLYLSERILLLRRQITYKSTHRLWCNSAELGSGGALIFLFGELRVATPQRTSAFHTSPRRRLCRPSWYRESDTIMSELQQCILKKLLA